MKQASIREFFQKFNSDEACLEHLFNVRFGQDHECNKCGNSGNWYRIKKEMCYSCPKCGHHIHPQVGTIFEKSRTPLQLWFYAVFLFTSSRHGVSAKELQRQLGVTYKTAWRMAKLIREHMANVDGDKPLGGSGEVVEVDEAYIGGRRSNSGGRPTDKAIVFGMVERGEGGEVVATVVPDVTRNTLHREIEKHVTKGTEVHADGYRSYNKLDEKGYDLKRITTKNQGKYVGSEGESVNAIENFWRHLKCSIIGTHNNVSAKHLQKYVKEFEYRFNRRMRPETMLDELLTRFPEMGS